MLSLLLAFAFIQPSHAYPGESVSIPNVTVTCGSADCAPQVAAIYAPYVPDGPGYCTGSLVGEANGHSLVLTDRHCTYGLFKNSNCALMIVQFPAQNGYPAVAARCDRVVEITPDVGADNFVRTGGRDYSVIELDRKIARPSYQAEAQPIDDQMTLTIPYLDTSKKPDLVVRSVQCHSGMNNPFDWNYVSSHDRIPTMFGCGLNPGTSGSPALNSNGKLVGLVFKHLDQYFGKAHFEANQILRMGCVQSDALHLNIDDAKQCQAQDGQEFTGPAFRAHAGKIIEDKIHQAIAGFSDKQNIFVFAADTKGPEITVPLNPNQSLIRAIPYSPSCFTNPAAWAPSVKNATGDTVVRMNVPVIVGYAETDEKIGYRIEVKLQETSTEFLFNPQNVLTSGMSLVHTNLDFMSRAVKTCP